MSKLLDWAFGSLIGLLSVLMSSKVYAHTLTLNPHVARSLTNHFAWTLKATCDIQTQASSKSKLVLSVVKNKSTVNGKSLSTGQTTAVTVGHHDHLVVSAEPGTELQVKNLGTDTLQAVCSV